MHLRDILDSLVSEMILVGDHHDVAIVVPTNNAVLVCSQGLTSFALPPTIELTRSISLVAEGAKMDFLKACVLFTVILGLVSLAGTIVNNGIALIDRIETNRSEGSNDYDAVVSAAVSMFRPIMMSMTTTVLGLLPLIFSRDPLFYGLVCVMAWGLAIGTDFTLVVVPTLYPLFFRVQMPGARLTAAAESA